VIAVPTLYPGGGAKQLIRVLTGIEVAAGVRSTENGVQCFNVATAYCVWRAITFGEPLLSRIITVTGNVEHAQNYEVLLGTPVDELVALAGNRADTNKHIMGGPMMGVDLPSGSVGVTKATNCIIEASPKLFPPPPPALPCIRCTRCADVCPAELQPQELYWFAKAKDFGKTQEYSLFDCIECGACAYVCPSNIPLVQYYRQEKAEIRAVDLETAKATEAKARFEAKQARMEREKLAREEKHQKSAVKLDTPPLEKVEIVEAATAEVDPRQAALAAAIARAKAKKAAATQEIPVAAEPVTTPSAPVETDDDSARKAAVAAAIARVKAKKAGNTGLVVEATDSTLSVTLSPAQPSADDKRKAAVAAAIARAKAKKAAAQEETSEEMTSEPTQQESDPRKAAVAAAIARVKARKAAAQTMSNEE